MLHQFFERHCSAVEVVVWATIQWTSSLMQGKIECLNEFVFRFDNRKVGINVVKLLDANMSIRFQGTTKTSWVSYSTDFFHFSSLLNCVFEFCFLIAYLEELDLTSTLFLNFLSTLEQAAQRLFGQSFVSTRTEVISTSCSRSANKCTSCLVFIIESRMKIRKLLRLVPRKGFQAYWEQHL